MKRTLIIGREEDSCCKLIQEQLSLRGRKTLFLREDRLFPGMDFHWKLDGLRQEGTVEYEGIKIDFEDFDGALARFYGVPISAERYSEKDGKYISSEWNALALAWMSAMPCKVINRVKPELWYKSVLNIPSLRAMLPGVQLKTPRTMISTDFKESLSFYERCCGRIIYNVLTLGSEYPIENKKDFERLSGLSGTLPVQLVETISGERKDIFVVGNRTLMDCNVDEGASGDASKISRECIGIAQALGLNFCRISLIIDCQGDAWFTGVDRMPHFFWLSPCLQANIAEALADELISNEKECAR